MSGMVYSAPLRVKLTSSARNMSCVEYASPDLVRLSTSDSVGEQKDSVMEFNQVAEVS